MNINNTAKVHAVYLCLIFVITVLLYDGITYAKARPDGDIAALRYLQIIDNKKIKLQDRIDALKKLSESDYVGADRALRSICTDQNEGARIRSEATALFSRKYKEESIPVLLQIIENTFDNIDLRMNALGWVTIYKDNPEVISALKKIALNENENMFMAQTANYTLAYMGDKEALDRFKTAAKNESLPKIEKLAILFYLRNLGDRSAEEPLKKMASDTEIPADYRTQLISLFENSGENMDLFFGILSNKNEEQSARISAFSKLRKYDNYDKLLELSLNMLQEKDSPEGLKSAILSFLREKKADVKIDILIDIIKDKKASSHLRHNAVLLAKEKNADITSDVLLEILKDSEEDPELRKIVLSNISGEKIKDNTDMILKIAVDLKQNEALRTSIIWFIMRGKNDEIIPVFETIIKNKLDAEEIRKHVFSYLRKNDSSEIFLTTCREMVFDKSEKLSLRSMAMDVIGEKVPIDKDMNSKLINLMEDTSENKSLRIRVSDIIQSKTDGSLNDKLEDIVVEIMRKEPKESDVRGHFASYLMSKTNLNESTKEMMRNMLRDKSENINIRRSIMHYSKILRNSDTFRILADIIADNSEDTNFRTNAMFAVSSNYPRSRVEEEFLEIIENTKLTEKVMEQLLNNTFSEINEASVGKMLAMLRGGIENKLLKRKIIERIESLNSALNMEIKDISLYKEELEIKDRERAEILRLAAEGKKDQIEQVIKMLKDEDEEESFLLNIIRVLSGVPDKKLIALMLEIANDEKRSLPLRINAINALGNIGNKSHLENLFKIAEKNTSLRKTAGDSIEQIMDYMDIKSLTETAEFKEEAIRKGAIRRILKFGDEKAKTFAFKLTGEKDDEIRYLAIREIANMQDSALTLPYLRKAVSDNNPEIRKIAVSALSNIGNSEDIDIFERSAKDDDPMIRKFAIMGIIRKSKGEHKQKVIEVLKNALNDAEKEIRETAIKAFGIFSDKSALPVLEEYIKNEKDYNLQRLAEKVIKNIK